MEEKMRRTCLDVSEIEEVLFDNASSEVSESEIDQLERALGFLVDNTAESKSSFPELEEATLQSEDSTQVEVDHSITYQDIYTNLLINEEVILCLNPEDIESTKRGIKNAKFRTAAKAKEAGILEDSGTLSFYTSACREIPGAFNLRVRLDLKGKVPLLRPMIIPKDL